MIRSNMNDSENTDDSKPEEKKDENAAESLEEQASESGSSSRIEGVLSDDSEEAIDPSLEDIDEMESLLDQVAAESEEGSDEEGADSSEPEITSNSRIEGLGEESPTGSVGDSDEDEEEEKLEILEGTALQGAIESVLFSTGAPLTVRQLAEAFEVSVHDIREAVENLRDEFEDSQRSFRLVEVGGGLQFLTLPRFFPWVSKFHKKTRAQRLSKAALETLAVIAYKQPLSRATLEGIRGVQCGPILKTLMDRGLVKIVGKEESLGHPLLYGTTHSFLESFGLPSIQQLPQPEADLKEDGH